MGHILLWFLLLLSLLNLHHCLHKQCYLFVFLDLLISIRGGLIVLLDVSDSEFVKFCRKAVVFHCSYYCRISTVHQLLEGNLSCMVLLFFTSSMMFPSSHNLSLLSNAFSWSFAFDALLGFCRSNY